MNHTKPRDNAAIQPAHPAEPNQFSVQLAVRVDEKNPAHHLWNNNGTWWCHLTVHHADYTTERLRISLKTRVLKEAMRKRDQLFQKMSHFRKAETSI